MGFSRQGYWNELPCPPPGDLPHPGIKPTSPAAPALQVGPLPLSHQGSPFGRCWTCLNYVEQALVLLLCLDGAAAPSGHHVGLLWKFPSSCLVFHTSQTALICGWHLGCHPCGTPKPQRKVLESRSLESFFPLIFMFCSCVRS